MALSSDRNTRSQVFASMLSSSALVALARVGGAIVGIVTQILLARTLGVDSLGIFFLTFSLFSIMSVICTLGYPMLVHKIAAEAKNHADEAWLARFLKLARRDTVVLSLIAATVVGAMVTLLPSLSHDMRTGLLIGVITAPVAALFRLNSALANAHRRFVVGFLPELFARPFLLLLLIGVLLQWDETSHVVAILAGNFFLVGAVAMFQYLQVRKMSPGLPDDKAELFEKPGISLQYKDWRLAAMPLAVAALFIAVFADLSILIAGFFLEQDNLGIFGTCLRISFLVAFGIQAVHQICFRDMADALQNGNRYELHKIMARGNAITLAVSLISFIALTVLATPVLRVFGAEFTDGRICLIILMLAQVVRASVGPAMQVLALTNRERATVPVFLASFVLLLASSATLIPYFGLNGAAISVLMATTLWSCGLALMAKHLEGANTATLRTSIMES